MKKADRLLISALFIMALAIFLFFRLQKGNAVIAYIYQDNELIEKVDLRKLEEPRLFTLKGTNGDVIIELTNAGARIVEETSKYNVCSKQGKITRPGETLICLPNGIYVKLVKMKSNEVVIG